MELKGLFTVVVTPFTTSETLDKEAFRKNLRFQLDKVDGIVVLGTTGEAPTLTDHESEEIIRIAVEEINHKIPLMVGTGTYSTKKTIENTAKAKDLGADMALVVNPYYNKPTQEGLYRHFKDLTAAVDFPICAYNIQGRCCVNIHTHTLERIADLPNIVGVKEASGDITQIGEVIGKIARQRPGFSVMSGDDALTLPLIALGGHGILSVVSNLIPRPIHEMVKAALKGDMEHARMLHHQLMPIFKGAFIETNPIPIKSAMQMCGMAAGPCRSPLCDLTPENAAKLKHIVGTIPKNWLQ